jgi:16S rRNA (guanine527-N7)-methyltransferase
MNTLSEYCLPFVKVDGSFIALKGNAEEEINESKNAVKVLGGKISKVKTYELPFEEGNRTVIEITKINKTPSLYPRGNGKERKNPL